MTQTAPPTNVVTRFAPSPTGFLHIGGARTALFNWLFARHCGGSFKLRIEDTDRERSTQDAVDAILEGMSWLGLAWDGDVVYQHARADRHREVVETLLATGHAYKCYATPDELAEMRAKAEAEKRPLIYDGRWRDRDPSDAPLGVSPAIRLKAPQSGETVISDHVQGRVVFQNENLDDLIILRSDGSPTYNLAVVADDYDMGVTHVVRGVDHLTNAARQALVYQALGWTLPDMAHLPLIHGPDGAKLSKRHGALGVEAYRAMGYLPAALRNYLVRLGWSHGDDEVFSTEQMTAWFALDGIGKSPARFDFAKLADLNGIYMRDSTDDELFRSARDIAHEIENGADLADRFAQIGWDRFAATVPSLKERSKTLVDLLNGARFLIAERPLSIEPKAAKHLDQAAKAHLAELAKELATIDNWTVEAVETAIRAYAEGADVKLGKVAQPLRVALTGSMISPPIFDLLAVLGKAETLARIADQAVAA
ncbi:MAG: glutamate--tRNA ligase [Pseudomonadota bacterium]